MKISEKLKEIRKNMFMKLVSKEKVKSLKEEKLLKGSVIVDVLKYAFCRGFMPKVKTKEDSFYLDGKIGSKGVNFCKMTMTIPLIFTIISLLSNNYKGLIVSLLMIGFVLFASTIGNWIFKMNKNSDIKKTYDENDLEFVYHKMKNLSLEDKKDLMGEHMNKNYFEEILKEIMQYVSKEEIMIKLEELQINNENDNFKSIGDPTVLFEVLQKLINEKEEKELIAEKRKIFKESLKLTEDILNNIDNDEKDFQKIEKREALTSHA